MLSGEEEKLEALSVYGSCEVGGWDVSEDAGGKDGKFGP